MQEKAKFIVEGIINALKELPAKAAEWFLKMKDKLVEIVGNVKTKISEKFNEIKSGISEKINAIKTSVTDTFNTIKTKMTEPVQKAKDTISNIIEKIKSVFNFKWSLPPLKLPHISVSGGKAPFGIGGKGSLPSFAIKWYKKAYEDPMMLENPTIFGYNPATGSFLGGGDKPNEDGEVVSGASKLMQMIQAAVSVENSAVIFYLERIMKFLAELLDGLPEWLDIDMVTDDGTVISYYTPKIDKELGKIKEQKDRGR